MKVLILDGNSILNRSFYGIKILSNKKGQYTNAIYGFMTTFQKIYDEFKPDAVAAAFDMPGPTFRKIIYDGYKANRKGMPDELASQLPVLKRLLTFLGYKIVECSGYEADDILGTLSYNFAKRGHSCLIATGDRDSLQLVLDNVLVRISSAKQGKSESTLYDLDKIKEVYGVTPKELIDIKALQGDASDNIPGVKGIGAKTAEALIQKFKSIDNIYKNIDSEDIKESVKKKLIEGKESAYMSRKLGEIKIDIPIDTDINGYIPSKAKIKEAKELLLELEFYSLLKKLIPFDINDTDNINEDDSKCIAVNELNDLDDLINRMKGHKVCLFIDYEDCNIKIMTLFFDKNLYLIKNEDNIYFNFIKEILEDKDISKTLYDSKKVISQAFISNIEVKNICFDIMLAAYVLNCSSTDYGLDRLIEEYNIHLSKILNEKNYNDEEKRALKYVLAIEKLEIKFTQELLSNDQMNLILKIEQPLAKVLSGMEITGFKTDKEGLLEYGEVLADSIEKLKNEVYKIMGFEFNINSPKQLGTALFEELGLPGGKKGKTGYSTSAKVLESIVNYHPAVKMILEYRTLSKLKSTYCDSMAKLIGKDGRIHAYFNQIETRTGRISCTDPNLQNIPVRTEKGRHLRKYFKADKSYLLVDADYSQIELRVLAHLSKDKNMIDAFNNGEDIHTLTASKIFNLPPEMLGDEARVRAKAVNFGIVYGIGAFSLSQDLGISRAEADRYIKAYLKKYDGVDKYMEEIVKKAKAKGYSETMFHRRRYLPELSSSNFNLRSFGERVARNMPIQGSAADIIKIAMIKVDKKIKERKLKSKLILQIHDELIVEAIEDEAEEVRRILKEEMESAADLNVPLIVNISEGKTWYDAKG